jgi:hypothetical protein
VRTTKSRVIKINKDDEEIKGDDNFDASNSSILMPERDISFDYSAKTNIFQLALTDFCPYFCSVSDLNGK